MQQANHLGEMLKARLAEPQQPIQLRLFDDKDYIEYEVNYAMGLSITEVYLMRESNPRAFYRVRAIRDATNRLRSAEKQWAKTISEVLGITD